MTNNTQDTPQVVSWQDELNKAIVNGLFRERYKILVLVAYDSIGEKNAIAKECTALFHQHGLIEEAQSDCYWLLEYLSTGTEKALLESVVNGAQNCQKMQMITDLHQYFYNSQRSALLFKSIESELRGRRTKAPIVCLAKAQSARWLYQTIGATSVLYLTCGRSALSGDYVNEEAFECEEHEDIRNVKLTVFNLADDTLSTNEKDLREQEGKPGAKTYVWYLDRPELLRFETDRVRKGCAGFAEKNMRYMNDRRYAYWIFEYYLYEVKCKVLALYHANFPNADLDNVSLVPMEPRFEDFKVLHGDLLDYRYDRSLKRNVISIRVRQEELLEQWGYAETAWKKLYSALNEDLTEKKRLFGSFPEKLKSILQIDI